ncbi:MAG: DUF1579 family protein, partial [Planctomycetes bacterium]|nr:DUF1579 family protein [Planctomycetota bacterium]
MKVAAVLAIALGLVAAFTLGQATAVQTEGQGMEGMPPMPEWMQLTECHKEMVKSCGTFDVKGTMWMVPGEPAEEFQATATRKMIMDGRFVQEDFVSEFMGMPFKGMSIEGYDTIAKEMVSIWIDSSSPYLSVQRGKVEKDGTMVMMGKSPDMMSGDMIDNKIVGKPSADGNTMTMTFYK